MKIAKPVAWVDPKYLPRQREGHTNVHLTLEARDVQRCALYTSEQIAEAVAAERERCAKVCEGERLEGVPEDPTDISYAEAVEHCIQAIRSAAK